MCEWEGGGHKTKILAPGIIRALHATAHNASASNRQNVANLFNQRGGNRGRGNRRGGRGSQRGKAATTSQKSNEQTFPK